MTMLCFDSARRRVKKILHALLQFLKSKSDPGHKVEKTIFYEVISHLTTP